MKPSFPALVSRQRTSDENLKREEERKLAILEEQKSLVPVKKKSTRVPLSLPHASPEDHIYYNVNLINNTNNVGIPVEYSVSTSDPIIKRPNDYEMAVVRFSVPGSQIPIMVWDKYKPVPGGGTPVFPPWDPITAPASKHQKFYVIVSDGTTTFSEPVVSSPLFQTNPLYDYIFTEQLNDGFLYRVINNYESFIQILNEAIREAFVSLKVVNPLITADNPPFLRYDGETELCEWLAPKSSFASPRLPFPGDSNPLYSWTNNPEVSIYFSETLFTLLPSFGYDNTFPEELAGFPFLDPRSYIGGILYQGIFLDTGNNRETIDGVEYLVKTQDYSTITTWNDLSSIQFETSTIPVKPEFQADGNNNNTLNKISRTLITDFVAPETTNNRDQIIYSGTGWQDRYTDLNSSYPIRDVTINVLWVDTWGNTYPLYMGWQESFSLKMVFSKKRRDREIEYYKDKRNDEEEDN